MATKPKNSGQSSVEFTLVLGLVIVPALLGGTYWVQTEWNRSECAYRTFKQARLQLLRTKRRSVQTLTCGNLQETIALLPLEDLDQNKGGLNFGDLIHEVSQLWEQLSFSSPPSLPLDSTEL